MKLTLIKRMVKFVAPYWKGVILTFILLALSSVLGLVGPVLLKRAVDVNIAQKDFYGLFLTSALYFIASVLMFYVGKEQMYRLEKIGQDVMFDLKTTLFSHLARLPVVFFDKTPVGKIISRIESDSETMRQLFTNTIVTFFGDILMLGGMIVIMFHYNIRLTLLVLSILPLLVVAAYFYEKAGHPIWVKVRKEYARISGFLNEFLCSVPTIQAFNREGWSVDKIDEANRNKFNTQYKGEFITIAFWNGTTLTEVLAISIVLFFGGNMALHNLVTIGTLVLFIGYIKQFFDPIRRISEQINILQRAGAAMERTVELMDMNEEVAPDGDYIHWRGLAKNIQFKNVSLSYDSQQYALKDINLTIRKGEHIALVGKTGGGKTSIAGLLFKFYNRDKGKISIDGIPIENLRTDNLRTHLGIILQDVHLFPGTVMDNIKLWDESISDKFVIDRAKQMGVDEYITRLTDSYYSKISESGGNLSLGEKQLIALLRAMVLNPDILVMDEATASIDSKTEAVIHKALLSVLKGRTAIIIAHRLSTIKDVDCIYVIKDGRIIEKGKHNELYEKDGYYRTLCNMEMK